MTTVGIAVDELARRLEQLQRRDAGTFDEQALTLDLDGKGLVGIAMIPNGAARRTALVICPAMLESAQFHRSEVRLARQAAALGYPAIYVQPPGFGESEGTQMTADVWQRVDAAIAAADEIRSMLASEMICLAGAGLGGTVALATAKRIDPPSSLILWGPVLDTRAHWAEAIRLTHLWHLSRGIAWHDHEQTIDEEGVAFIAEMLVTRRMLRTLHEVGAVATERVPGKSPALLVTPAGPKPPMIQFEAARPVTHASIEVHSDIDWGEAALTTTIDRTIDWIGKHLP